MENESLPFIVEQRPVGVCEKDEYSANILLNQVMVTTLQDLHRNPHIEERTRKECFILWEQLPGVEDIKLTRELFMRIQFFRHNVHYKPMIHLARLLHELRLLSHKKGDWSLFTVELTETEFNRLFEKFLFHFYRLEQSEYIMQSERLNWKLEGNHELLPTMLTDVSLVHRTEQKRIVMDAKFYKNMFQQVFGRHSFHSHNLYQIFTYLMHQPEDEEVRGILIYPENQYGEIEERYVWDERIQMEVHSVNLDASWSKIRKRLLAMLDMNREERNTSELKRELE